MTMERPGLVRTVLAVFVFLAAFLAVASYFGGGTAGLVSAGLVAVAVMIVYLLFFGWIARSSVVRRLIEPTGGPGFVSSPSGVGGERSLPIVSNESPSGREQTYARLAFGDTTNWMPWNAKPRRYDNEHFWRWWDSLPGLLDRLDPEDRADLMEILEAEIGGVSVELQETLSKRFHMLRERARHKLRFAYSSPQLVPPYRRGPWDFLWSSHQERERKRRIMADLEGEVNRRIVNIIKGGGAAAWELRNMLDAQPRRQKNDPIRRAMVVSAVENAHGAPTPFDLHAFARERLAALEREDR